jgi:hypothetical protein
MMTHGDAQVLIGDYKLIEHIGHKIIENNNIEERVYILE